MIKILTLVCVSLAVAAKSEQKFFSPELSLPLMKKTPIIDGVFTPEEWKGAAQMERFNWLSKDLFPADAKFLVGADNKNLYIVTICETGPEGISQKVQSSPDNAMAYLDDYVELVIIPSAGKSKGTVHHMIINNKGALFSRAQRSNKSFIKWRPEKMLSKGIVKNKVWTFEMAIPWEDFGVSTGTKLSSIGLRICRGWRGIAGKNHTVQTNWTPQKVAFFSNIMMPVINFQANAPVVKVLQLKDSRTSKDANIEISVYNPGKKTIDVKTWIKIHPLNSQDITEEKTLAISPGKTKIASLKTTPLNNEKLSTFIKVTSPDNKKVFYSRAFRWEVDRPKKIFASKDDTSSLYAAKFAFYPSFNKLVLNVDTSSIKKRDKVTKVTVDLLDQDGKKLETYKLPPMKNYITEIIVDTPNLKALSEKRGGKADYKLVFKVLAGNKPIVVEQKFVRNVMEWEGNSLGKSNIIIPPFTPIKTSGMTLETILRRYKIDNLGLWKQVNAAGKNIFARNGMKLIALVNGKEIEVKGRNFKFTKKKPWTIETQATWSVGAVKGISKTVWDYDGMMKWFLTLKKGGKLEGLKLIIPLLDKKTSLMHTCADGVRINFGGAVPEGNGKIWSSDKAIRMSLLGSYLPYIWLGGTLRGISVFGDNDKGWTQSKTVAAQELIRENGVLKLVLNLVAKPVNLNKERNIQIGFLATPIKPMPENWRLTNMWNWIGNSQVKQFTKKIIFYGSCWYWGALTPCKDIYPANKNMEYWRKLAETRRTGKIDYDFIKKWLKTYKYASDVGSKDRKKAEKKHFAHVKGGFRRAKFSKPATNAPTMFYINARGVRFDTLEGKTFIDEWCRMKFYARKSTIGYGVAYDVPPCNSFQNYSMWYYKKMLETGACDLFYWDDVFMSSEFNPVNSEVYKLPDGRTQPSAGLFGMRDLVRRGAILQAEMGRESNNMVHMTNTNVLPITAFAKMSYDWEDHGGTTPFQERYTKEYIQALTIGRQAGNFPAVLANIRGGTKEQRKWCERTATGVMLTHELRWTKGKKPHWNVVKLIYNFGYGQPENKIYNYWDKESYPIEITGPDNSSLVMKKKDGVMIIVCDYSAKGENKGYSIKPDLKELGLSNNFTASNMEISEKLEVKNGKINFTLKRHDFIIIKVSK